MSTQRALIRISDPWDFGEALSWRPLEAELRQIVTDSEGGRALLKLNEPVEYKKSTWSYVIASPRYQGDSIDALKQGNSLDCTFTAISDGQASSSNPWDLSAWRGGLAFQADLEPLTKG